MNLRGPSQVRFKATLLGHRQNLLSRGIFQERQPIQRPAVHQIICGYSDSSGNRRFGGQHGAIYQPRTGPRFINEPQAGSSSKLKTFNPIPLFARFSSQGIDEGNNFAPSKEPNAKQEASKHSQNSTSSSQYEVSYEKVENVFRVSKEVIQAIESKAPVVALETTIYTHGFPWPANLDLARSLEKIIRENGAIPATIGVIDGIAVVGLNDKELIDLCSRAADPETMKVSRRDIPYILGMGVAGRKISGGTTVSGTMFICAQVGIKVFGTGGLGGVHRGGEDSMDISADLTELGRTPVAVVSSGCKSFLDIPRTLEYLETQGATVCTFADGRTGQIDFPSFYTRDSGIKSPMVIQSAKEGAAMIHAQDMFGRRRSSGMLLANPISEEFSMPKEQIDTAINQAVKEAADRGFHGHANTPFILDRLKQLTKGQTLPVNRALIQRNVAMAAKVAVELAKFKEVVAKPEPTTISTRIADMSPKEVSKAMSKTRDSLGDLTKQLSNLAIPKEACDILVLGSVALDLSCDYTPKGKAPGDTTISSKTTFDVVPEMHTSNVATITQSIGGVGHNVALAAHRAGAGLTVRLQSAVGDDLAGNFILQAMKEVGLDTSRIEIKKDIPGEPAESTRTAQYVAINDRKKDLVMAMADMSIFSDPRERKKIIFEEIPDLKWAVVDANWDPSYARLLMKHFKSETIKIAFEPVSTAKASRLFEPPGGLYTIKDHKLIPFPNHTIDLATPNQHELQAMFKSAHAHEFFQGKEWWRVIDALGIPSTGARDRFIQLTSRPLTDAGIPTQTIQLLPFIPTILTKLGAQGVLLTKLLLPSDPRLTDPDSAPYILSRCSNGSTEIGGVYMRHFPAVERVSEEEVRSVNGVGDTFLGVLVAGLARGVGIGEGLIGVAQKGAVLTLKSRESVSPRLGELASELEELARVARG